MTMESENSSGNSNALRRNGNKIYYSVKNGMPEMEKRLRLLNAIDLYRQAIECAENRDEKSAALKNMGIANVKLGTELDQKIEFVDIKYFLKEGIACFSEGYMNGKSVKPVEWQDNIIKRTREVLDYIEDKVADLPIQQKISVLEECTYATTIDSVRGEYCMKLADMMYYEALPHLKDKNYKKILERLRDCHRPIEEASNCMQSDENHCSEIRVRREEIMYLTCRGEFLQALSIGKL